MSIAEALKYTPWTSETALYQLIEEGAFWAYRILPSAPWRISGSDFARWLQGRQNGARPAREAEDNGTPKVY